MANAKKGGGKQQEFVAVFEVPLAEKKHAHKAQAGAVRFESASMGAGGGNAPPFSSLNTGNPNSGGGGSGPTLSITPNPANVVSGQQLAVDVQEVFNDGVTPNLDVTGDPNLTWSAPAGSGVALTVDNSGNWTVQSNSTATVQTTLTASYDDLINDVTATGQLTLTIMPSVPTTVTVSPNNPTIPAGTTQQFTATGYDSTGKNVIPIPGVQWSSNNTSFATVDPNTGLATAVAQGNATISAAVAGVSGSTSLNVDAATPTSITVQPLGPPQLGPLSVGCGETLQLTAIATYSDGTAHDITAQATWTVQQPAGSNFASVSMGLVTGVNTGNATVQASYQTATPGSVPVTVVLNFPDLGAADSQAFANAKSRVNQLLTAFERRGNLSDGELAQLKDGLELVTRYLNNNPSTSVPNFNAASKAGNNYTDLQLLGLSWNSSWSAGPIGTGSGLANVIDDRFRAICDYLYGPPPVTAQGVSLEHDPGSFPGGNGQYNGLTPDQLRVAAIYGYVMNSQATPPPYRAVPSPLIVDDPSQRALFNQSVEAADAAFRTNTQLYIATLARLVQTSQMPQINVGDLAAVVDILVQQGIGPNNSQLNIWIDRALATAQNVGQDAPPSQISINLPDLEQSISTFEIIPDNIFALQPAYFCSMLEQLKVFQVVEKLVELFQNGVLPVLKGTAGNLLFAWWKNAALRVSESERRGFYARSLGFPGGDADSPNREFKDLFMRFVSAVSSFVRQNTVDNLLRSNIPGAISQQQVRKSARDLATNISSHGYGIAYPMATELQKELTDVMNILTNGEIQGAYGAKDMWQLVDQVAALELGGNKNSVKYRTMASAGAVVFAWLAGKATMLATNSYVPIIDITQLQNPPTYSTKATTNPSDFDLVGACDQWLAVTGTQEDTVEQQAQPVEAPVMPSRPIQIPSVARDMLESVGIPAGMSYAAGSGGNGKAPGSVVNWRVK